MNIRKRFTLIVAAGLALSSLSGKDIKGRVTDTDGVPMEFVNVVLLHDSVFVDELLPTATAVSVCHTTQRRD